MARRAPRSAASASSTSPTGSAATASRPATGSWSPPSPTRSAPRWRTRGWSSAISASSGSGASCELAHDLQLKLLPSPAVLQGDAEVAARCFPADSVGGDFYTFTRLGRGRVGVMLGDVASHGFSAALVMALVHVGRRHPRRRLGHARRDAERAARQPLHRAGRDRDVLQRVLRRARPADRPALVRQRGSPLRVPGAAVRRPGAAGGHGAAAGTRHRGQHPAAPGAVERGPRSAGALDRRPGGRAERGGRAVRRAAAARRGVRRIGTSRPRRS